jgi:chromosomal replication initiation ATPase DnaA
MNANPETIFAEVCQRFNVTPEELTGHSKVWRILLPRYITIGLLREAVPLREIDIAAILHRNPSNISRGLRTLADLEATDKRARAGIAAMREKFGIHKTSL